MYFLNIIPPIPLAMEDVGVYYSITRTAHDKYEAVGEKKEWLDYFRRYDTISIKEDQPIFLYSAVFSPTRFSITIFHHWYYFDEVANKWQSAQRIELPIVGGRDGGYRTYSIRSSPKSGFWRVDVETPRRQIIGRVKFQLVANAGEVDIVKEVLK